MTTVNLETIFLGGRANVKSYIYFRELLLAIYAHLREISRVLESKTLNAVIDRI